MVDDLHHPPSLMAPSNAREIAVAPEVGAAVHQRSRRCVKPESKRSVGTDTRRFVEWLGEIKLRTRAQ